MHTYKRDGMMTSWKQKDEMLGSMSLAWKNVINLNKIMGMNEWNTVQKSWNMDHKKRVKFSSMQIVYLVLRLATFAGEIHV